VLKGAAPTIEVAAYNPEHGMFTRWLDHPYLQDVYVRYRRVGDSDWLRANKTEGTFASFGKVTNDEGFTDAMEVDVSSWVDGEYELILVSACGDLQGKMGSNSSSAMSARGRSYVSSPLQPIRDACRRLLGAWGHDFVRMTEDIDCRKPFTLSAQIVIASEEPNPGDGVAAAPLVLSHNDLDVKCFGDSVGVLFSFESDLYAVTEGSEG